MKVGNFKVSSINTEARKNFTGRSGDTVRVSIKIKEGDKSRIQDFEGIITARKHGTEPGATFTVRKIASGVGVERIFPLYSPVIDSIEIKKRGRARKSKLYFIKEKAQREISRKMKSEVVNEKAIRNDDVEVKAEATA